MKHLGFRITSIIALALSVTTSANAEEPEAADSWAPVRVLLGEWQGVGVGFGVESRVRHTYEFVIQDHFIHSTTLSEFQPKKDGAPAEIHEDWGFLSYDSDRGKIVFRQFLSEGFVNTYLLEDPAPGSKELVFSSEHTEGAGGMAARLTFSFDGIDAYRLVLELASPGKDFFACQTLDMKRRTGD
jgi:hypothetical protein